MPCPQLSELKKNTRESEAALGTYLFHKWQCGLSTPVHAHLTGYLPGGCSTSSPGARHAEEQQHWDELCALVTAPDVKTTGEKSQVPTDTPPRVQAGAVCHKELPRPLPSPTAAPYKFTARNPLKT